MLKVKLHKEFVNFILLIIIYLLLVESYIHVISKIYNYIGFDYLSPDLTRTVITLVLVIIVSYLVSFTKLSLFARFFLNLMLIIILFPTIILFKYMHSNPQILLAHVLFFASVYFSLKYLKIKVRSPAIKHSQRFTALFVIIILMILPFIYTYKTHINFSNLFLQDVYKTRALFREIGSTYFNYTYSWLSDILIPIALVFALVEKKRIKAVILFFLLIYLFLCGAHKSVLFGSFLVLITYLIHKRKIIIFFNISIIVLLIGSKVLMLFLNNSFVAGLITERVFFVPPLLDTYYFQFFTNNHMHWSYSVLKWLYNYPYQLPPSRLIGLHFFNNSFTNANNGIISSGFMNWGWIGIIFNILVISFVLSYFNSLKINSKFWGIFILLLGDILSSYLTTMMLTGGVFLLILVAQFFLKDTNDKLLTET